MYVRNRITSIYKLKIDKNSENYKNYQFYLELTYILVNKINIWKRYTDKNAESNTNLI